MLFVLVLVSATMIGCARSIDNDAVVSTVNGFEITLGLANFYARFTQGQQETFVAPMFGMDPATMWSEELFDGSTQEEAAKESIMTDLQNLVMIYQRANEFGVALTDADRSHIEEVARTFIADNSPEALEAVSGQLETIILYLELVTIGEKMFIAMREGVDEYVSDEEALQKGMDYIFIPFMETTDDGIVIPMEEFQISEITSQAIMQLEIFREDAEEGLSHIADFFGVDIISDTFSAGTPMLNEWLVEAVDALETEGEMTGLIETENGIFIGQLTSLLDREATDNRIEEIIEDRRQEQFASLLEQWRAEAEITLDERVWAQVDFVRMGIVIIQQDLGFGDFDLDEYVHDEYSDHDDDHEHDEYCDHDDDHEHDEYCDHDDDHEHDEYCDHD